jgi:hypothetical protein
MNGFKSGLNLRQKVKVKKTNAAKLWRNQVTAITLFAVQTLLCQVRQRHELVAQRRIARTLFKIDADRSLSIRETQARCKQAGIR